VLDHNPVPPRRRRSLPVVSDLFDPLPALARRFACVCDLSYFTKAISVIEADEATEE
jgi:hypothetical protein